MKHLFDKMLNKELEELNETFSPFEFDTGVFNGSVYPDSMKDDVYWARVFIKIDGVQIGRLTYRFTEGLERYYTKQYKPDDYEFDSNDLIFYQLQYYFRTGEVIADLPKIVADAFIMCENELKEKKQWRIDNPPTNKKKRRKALKGRNPRHVITQLVSELP